MHYRQRNCSATSSIRFIVACAFLCCTGAINSPASADEPCEPGWDNAIGQPGMNGAVIALTVFDDGSGPALYAGGNFTTAGGVSASRIAKWDGQEWSALDSGMNNSVHALTVFDDGSGPALYAGGNFTTAGGVSASRIAKWDGQEWSALDSGMSGAAGSGGVATLMAFDDGPGQALYAGGDFTTAGGQTVNNIARWDGEEWSALGNGMDGPVIALAGFDDDSGIHPVLYAGGDFTTAGGQTVNNIARWDGEEWLALDSGLDDPVLALTVFDDGSGEALYAGGIFSSAEGMTVNGIAKWHGGVWSALGSGVSGDYPWVHSLTVFDDGLGPALYAGGNFMTAGGVNGTSRITQWNGEEWSALDGGMNGGVIALTVFNVPSEIGGDPALYAGGHFTTAGDLTVNRIASWQGADAFECEPGAQEPQEVCFTPSNMVDPQCIELALEDGKKYLVVIVHGWQPLWGAQTTPETMQEVACEIEQRITENPLLNTDEWQVVALDWFEIANTPSPSTARWWAAAAGGPLAEEIAQQEYEYVHMIAHSAGSAMIARAAQLLGGNDPQYSSPDTQIMNTFLDPYGTCENFTWWGENTTWSDGYYTSRDDVDVLSSSVRGPLGEHVFDVDVTNVDQQSMDGCECSFHGHPNDCPSTHGWPVCFYRHTITGGGDGPCSDSGSETCGEPSETGFYGFGLSMEGGNLVYDPESEQYVWNVDALPNAAPACNTESTLGPDPCPETDAWQYEVSNSTIPYANMPQNPNTLCSPTIAGDGMFMDITTCPSGWEGGLAGDDGSIPSWINFLIDLEETTHEIAVDVEFTSEEGAEGLLSLFLDGQHLLSVDERYVADGMQTVVAGVPGNFQAGTHVFSVRLEDFSDVSSSATVSSPEVWTVDIVPACEEADVNCDGEVNVDDLLIILNNWGECADCGDCLADITGDCTVNVDDLLIILNNWG